MEAGSYRAAMIYFRDQLREYPVRTFWSSYYLMAMIITIPNPINIFRLGCLSSWVFGESDRESDIWYQKQNRSWRGLQKGCGRSVSSTQQVVKSISLHIISYHIIEFDPLSTRVSSPILNIYLYKTDPLLREHSLFMLWVSNNPSPLRWSSWFHYTHLSFLFPIYPFQTKHQQPNLQPIYQEGAGIPTLYLISAIDHFNR